ncbi:RNA polymerase sigma factor [Fodinicola feengrottensis]|uniref:RNA polymerase sigma factor n=1 Tax=Fodinicola feengrottensis TaxID=435914 RepID=UPI0013D71D43|nr:sigma factor-like helix-turn-helix DNA-binding protein [Fodinicola feengrottensis]
MDGPSERERLDEIFRACYGRLVITGYALTGNITEAQDVVAEARRSCAGSRIGRRCSRPTARRHGCGPFYGTLFAGDGEGPGSWSPCCASPAGAPVAEPELSPDRVAVMAAIGRLPAAQRDTVALFYIADLPVNEIAATLGVPVGTVKARLSRARAALSLDLKDTVS